MTTIRNSSFFADLSALLTGRLVLPQDTDYEQVRQLWSAMVNTHPAAIIRCKNAQDVVHTVRWAYAHGLELSVRGGGHDFAGRALCEDGIVVDCSLMNAVSIDPVARTARIQGGATANNLIDAAQKVGLATTTGTVSSVGMAGLTLGGGYGPLMGAYGLAIDNLLEAQVVTADGNLVMANVTEHPDLFWGLRGGGGNFGVVVSLKYRLYPLTTVLAGLLLYPLNQAKEVLRYYDTFIKTAPDELTIQIGFIQMPDGTPLLFLSPVYCGPLKKGEQVLAPLRAFGQPLADQIQPTTYDVFINSANDLSPKGRHYFAQTRSLDGLPSKTIEILIEQAQQFSAPFSGILLHHFHGAASRVSSSETAFALRQDHFMVEIVAAWESQSPEDDQKHVQWAHRVSQILAPYALERGYINMMDKVEHERVQLAFGPNYERLLKLKRTYDPNDVFHSASGHITPTAIS